VALLPTVLLIGIGIILLVLGNSTTTLVTGILVLALCTAGITGYVLSSIFVNKGASLVRVQNDFVSSVSHELRTPITSIRLLIESLADGRLEDAERGQVLSLLARETLRLEELVGRVLELSKLQSSYAYARDRIEVAALIDEAIAAFDAFDADHPDPHPPHRRARARRQPAIGRRSFARSRICSPTRGSTTGTEKRIEIEARAVGRWIELIVRDNGGGVEHDEQRLIFEQFMRGRAAHEGGAPGIGLGLSFVQAIVRGHRGKIDVESNPGETAFRIRLPRGREPAELESPALVEGTRS